MEQIQRQLLTLSHLPFDAKVTLDSVTDQLAKLVKLNGPEAEEEEDEVSRYHLISFYAFEK